MHQPNQMDNWKIHRTAVWVCKWHALSDPHLHRVEILCEDIIHIAPDLQANHIHLKVCQSPAVLPQSDASAISLHAQPNDWHCMQSTISEDACCTAVSHVFAVSVQSIRRADKQHE